MRRAHVELAWKTRTGHRHQVEGLPNEDAVWVTDVHPRYDALLLVADGMGGHPRPREASRAAVESCRAVLTDTRRLAGFKTPEVALQAALRAAQAAVRLLAEPGDRKPPGSTLSVALVAGDLLHVAHLGDGSVFLVRKGATRRIAGGEDRRTGNRPAQFLGQAEPLEPELAAVELCEGDRLMLCTDGLTRYFCQPGGALMEVLTRTGVGMGALAGQLTAHARPDDYDDDTTVALVEIAGFYEATDPVPVVTRSRPEVGVHEGSHSPSPLRPRAWAWTAGACLALAWTAGAFALGRVFARPHPPRAVIPSPVEPATPAALRKLPAGNLVLFDAVNHRLFVLATRPMAAPEHPTRLQAFRVGADGRLDSAGMFRLDTEKGVLTLPDGATIPVKADYAAGSLRVVRPRAPAAPEVRVRTRPETDR